MQNPRMDTLQAEIANTAAPIYVADSDLGSFKKISNNVWSVGGILAYAQGGVNYIWPSWSDSRGYQTPTEWNNLSQVGSDSFPSVSSLSLSSSTFAPSSSSVAANAGAAAAGVFVDFDGDPRPTSGSISAGAVEV